MFMDIMSVFITQKQRSASVNYQQECNKVNASITYNYESIPAH